MRLLIVEDDSNKYKQVVEFIQASFSNAEITSKRSYQSGLREILKSEAYDLIILDMSLPTYDITPKEQGGPFLTYAGEEILDEMKRKGNKGRILIVTQYETFGEGKDSTTLEQLKARLRDKFPQNYCGTIYYNAAETNWKNSLSNVIGSIIK